MSEFIDTVRQMNDKTLMENVCAYWRRIAAGDMAGATLRQFNALCAEYFQREEEAAAC